MATKTIGNLVFAPALKHAIAEALHDFIASSMMPAGAVITIRMETKVHNGLHCIHNRESFYDLYESLHINVTE